MIPNIKQFLNRHKKYAPVIFFIGGFIWDSMTLGRVDGWYSNTVLFTYLICLTICLYIYNLSIDDHWEHPVIKEIENYAPLGIQFFLGGLSSAYVIFFFRSVSLTKTAIFFLLLVALLISNELLKHRISNKYLQFGAYLFVSFTFFTFMLPVVIGIMNPFIFFISGLLGLGTTLLLVTFLYFRSPSTKDEVTGWKITTLLISIYLFINACYYFNLIPPVPMALESGMVAYDVEKVNHSFRVSYEKPTGPARFWRPNDKTFNYSKGDTVFVYTSIFAPTDLHKRVQHQWQWYNKSKELWETSDIIGYNVIGGRAKGYRGFTFKTNVHPGQWRVNVTTENGLVLGKLNFIIKQDSSFNSQLLTTKLY